MGTRALVSIEDEANNEIVVIYRQYDGYVEGLGEELWNFLKDMKVVNGLPGLDEKTANGMGCLAAQLVDHLKDRPGNVYLYPAGTRDCGEEFHYVISLEKKDSEDFRSPVGVLNLKIMDGPMTAFGMSSEEGATRVLYDGAVVDFDPEHVTQE